MHYERMYCMLTWVTWGLFFCVSQPSADINQTAHRKFPIIVQGRIIPMKTITGWVMGGGHSALSPRLGLGIPLFPFVQSSLNSWYDDTGVDNVLQFTIVLANGSFVTANSYQHPGLFWALRGGVGGTYGVVTSTTYQIYPTFPVISAFLTTNFSSPDIAPNVTTEYICWIFTSEARLSFICLLYLSPSFYIFYIT